jgi:hypothetical protein
LWEAGTEPVSDDMMSAKQTSRKKGGAKPGRRGVGPGATSGDEPEHISATDRWLMISKRVYTRAQQRGFVGGDPFADLAEAAREIDEQYITDVPGLLSLTDPAEMMDQLRSLFASYGLSRQNLDQVLEKNRDAIEKLARMNRSKKKPAQRQAAQRKSLLKKTANQAISALQNFNREVEDRTRNIPFLGQSAHATQSILSSLARLASSAGEMAGATGGASDRARRARHQRELEVHRMVVKAYDGLSPAELADAPIAALKGISEASARKLKSAFGMRSIRDMAGSKVFERADGVVTLADAEQTGETHGAGEAVSLPQIAEGPVYQLKGVTPHQARVLQHTLKIASVRDLSSNRFFRLARAIVSLADGENRSP